MDLRKPRWGDGWGAKTTSQYGECQIKLLNNGTGRISAQKGLNSLRFLQRAEVERLIRGNEWPRIAVDSAYDNSLPGDGTVVHPAT